MIPVTMKLIVIGAGAHAKVVIEAIRAAALGEIVGLIDPSPNLHSVLGVPIIGDDDDVERLRNEGVESAVVALGGNALRLKIANKLRNLGFTLPAVIHPSALVSPSARVEEGAILMARAVLGTESVLRALAIVNTAASVDHDNLIGVAAHIAPGCALAGNVEVGERALVGVGSAIVPGVRIGAGAVVGAGSAVVRHVGAGTTVGGAPARILRLKEQR